MVFRKPKPAADDKPAEGGLTHDLSNSATALLSYVERVERLTEEIDGLSDDRKEVYGEAKATGFDAGVLRKAIARRKMDPAAREKGDAILELYEDTIRKAEKAQFVASEAMAGD